MDFGYEKIYKYLEKVNRDFPIPLSDKVNLNNYCRKILSKADIYCEIKKEEIIAMVIGYIKNAEDRKGYIAMVSVSKEYRKHGLAEKMVRRFLSDAKKEKLEIVHLYTHKSNWKAQRLYEKIGFIEEKNNSGYRCDDIHFIYKL